MRNMNKGKRLFKAVSLVMACIICVNLCCVSSYAASITWSLVRTNGPSSEWVTERTYGFDATKTTISIKCTAIQNSAVAHAALKDSVTGKEVMHGHLYEGTTLKKSNAVKGRNYAMKVSFESYGTGYSRPTGTISY